MLSARQPRGSDASDRMSVALSRYNIDAPHFSDSPENHFDLENSRPTPSDRELVKSLDLTVLHQVRRGHGSFDLGDGLFSTGIEELPEICASIRGAA
jgi:hypothetical protein